MAKDFVFLGDTVNMSDCFKNFGELKSLREQGVDPVIARYGEVDIAYPASEKEYCALAGYSFMKITAIAEDAKELPIERAYFQLRNGKIMPLESLEVSVDDRSHFTNRAIETKDDKDRVYYKNFSFWAIPTLFFLDNGGLIGIDFRGERKEFVILRGPWKIDPLINGWMRKHSTKNLQVAERANYDIIAKFIEREFCGKHV